MALRMPPLRAVHEERGAKFTEFGGWDMPVEFDSIRAEHESVRESAGIFDVSHMGEIEVSGPDARQLLQRLTTNDVAALEAGDSQYSTITTEQGVMLDDIFVYRLPDDEGRHYLVVPNAGNDEATEARFRDHREAWGLDATIENRTDDYAMFAVQGPDAPALVAEVTEERILDLSKFEARYATVAGTRCWVARTGYTGEDGFEVIVPVEAAEAVWRAIDCQPCGLGARDTLRQEMGYLLSGQDFDPETDPRTPYEAGVGFTVKLGTEFVGRDALEQQYEEGVEEKFVGFKLIDRGIARHGYDVTNTDGVLIGEITSGTMSPSLGEAIGLGYVPVSYADPGTTVRVMVRGSAKKAKIETTPFLKDN